MIKSTYPLLFLAIFECIAWQPKTSQKVDTQATQENFVEEFAEEGGFNSREPNDDEIREFGLIADLQDAAYPIFIVLVEIPERGQTFEFNMNVEAAELSHDWPEFTGKYATIYYQIDELINVFDLQYQGASTQGEYAPPIDPTWESITGILSGADRPSGDLPIDLSIKTANGKSISFEYFVDDLVMQANGQNVEIFYEMTELEMISYLELAKD